jgi:peptidoglycan/LPS O-acetylase OafA/YrhL
LVIVEGDHRVIDEREDLSLSEQEAFEQVVRCGLLDPAALVRAPCRRWIGREPGRQQCLVASDEAVAVSAGTAPLLATGAALLVGLPLNTLWLHSAGLIPAPPPAFVGCWPQEAASAWLWSVAGPWVLAARMAGLLVGALRGPKRRSRLWAWTPLRIVGLISYSLYVWHALLQHQWQNLWDAHWAGQPEVLEVAGYLALLFALAALSYQFIERPFLRARRGIIPPMPRWLTRKVAMLGGCSPQETMNAQ